MLRRTHRREQRVMPRSFRQQKPKMHLISKNRNSAPIRRILPLICRQDRVQLEHFRISPALQAKDYSLRGRSNSKLQRQRRRLPSLVTSSHCSRERMPCRTPQPPAAIFSVETKQQRSNSMDNSSGKRITNRFTTTRSRSTSNPTISFNKISPTLTTAWPESQAQAKSQQASYRAQAKPRRTTWGTSRSQPVHSKGKTSRMQEQRRQAATLLLRIFSEAGHPARPAVSSN